MARISQHTPPHGEYHGVVIIGGGIAGLVTAQGLREAGFQALVLEQASAVGGRCSTVSVFGTRCDPGAQFFSQRRPGSQRFIDYWLERGCIREWTRGFPELKGITERAGHPRYCGVSGMSSLCDSLSEGLQIRTSRKVKRIVEGRACWLIEVEGEKRIKADMVVMALPVPEALRLISDENTWRMGALLLPLTGVTYVPHVTVAALLDGASGLPEPGAARVDDPVVAWLADNHRKGISAQPVVTIHGTRAFMETQRHESSEVIAQKLVHAASPLLQHRIVDYCWYHWAWGVPVNTLPRPHYLVEGRAPLYFAGDSFSGGLVEGAALSGLSAGTAIAERLKRVSSAL